MSKQLMIKPEKCLGCRTCELVCSFGHFGVFNPKLANVTVLAYDESAICVPVMCMQCSNPSCVKACPVGAMTKGRDGLVTLNQEKCIGCKMCMNACPLGNININYFTNQLHKCDLCGGDPKCAKFCPSGAITFVDTVDGIDRRKAVADNMKEVYGEEVM